MTDSFSQIRFNDLFHVAHSRRASDIHFVPGLRASIRVDGALEYVDGPAVTARDTSGIVELLLDAPTLSALNSVGDATCTWNGSDKGIVRVHALRAQGAAALSLRLLPASVPPLESLHLPEIVRSFVQRQRGLVLIAGPTGSGKSTSLASLIAEINRRSARRIITIEDPIEYRHEGDRSSIIQREIGRDVPTFADAVLGALRSDPDVIMIGEMRDAKTIRASMTAAETGHLVLATLHTGDAVQTIDRIIDAFSGQEQPQIRAQLSSVLVAVVCQRLLPRTSGTGRRVAAEILIATDAVRATIREARTHQLRNLMLTGRDSGMQTLEHHLVELLAERVIDRATAYAHAERHSELNESSFAIV